MEIKDEFICEGDSIVSSLGLPLWPVFPDPTGTFMDGIHGTMPPAYLYMFAGGLTLTDSDGNVLEGPPLIDRDYMERAVEERAQAERDGFTVVSAIVKP